MKKINNQTMDKGFFKSHSKDWILRKCKYLKQTDGEGWIIGDFVEKYINGDIIIIDKSMLREIKLKRILENK